MHTGDAHDNMVFYIPPVDVERKALYLAAEYVPPQLIDEEDMNGAGGHEPAEVGASARGSGRVSHREVTLPPEIQEPQSMPNDHHLSLPGHDNTHIEMRQDHDGHEN